MSNLTVFNFGSNEVRTALGENGEPLFCGKDVCEVLTIKNFSDAISGLDEDEKSKIMSIGKPDWYITESGLYTLILKSSKPEAKAFKKWVTSEVLPSIRKTGRYTFEQKETDDLKPQKQALEMAKLAVEAAKAFGFEGNQAYLSADNTCRKLTGVSPLNLLEIELIAPVQKKTHTPTELGKMMNPQIGGRAVNALLFEAGLQTKAGDEWLPTEKAKGLYEISDTTRRHTNGVPIKQMKWFDDVLELIKEGEADE